MSTAIKGPSIGLPTGIKDSLVEHERSTTGEVGFTAERGIRRVYWWKEGEGSPQEVLGLTELNLSDEHTAQLQRVMDRRTQNGHGISGPEKPVFFGHYHLGDDPHLTSDRAVCLDFRGKVTAYRHNDGDGKNVFADRIVSVDVKESAEQNLDF